MADFASRFLSSLSLDTIFGSETARPPAWHKFRHFFSVLAAALNYDLGAAPQTVDMNDTGFTLKMQDASGATQANLVSTSLLVDPDSGGASEILTIPAAADLGAVRLFIKNTGGEGIVVTPNGETSLGTIPAGGIGIVICNGTVAYMSPVTNEAASAVTVLDVANYYAGGSVEAVLAAIAVQIGGLTDLTYNFTNGTGTRLADNDAVYAALNKLDQGFVDLISVANAKGASLVGIEDSLALITATNVETALAELVKYEAVLLADPGTGVAIPVTRSATINIVTAGAETNTLAIPTFHGQTLVLNMDTRTGGDRVVTSAQAINQAGNTIMTFGAARDFIVLRAVKVASAFRWQVAYNDGVALS